jgi:hypothetical protein
MIDLIRATAVPATLMQSAARGALSVPADEMIEILVHLSNHNKVFGQLARITLAGWDEKACLLVASNPNTPQEVLDYWTAAENLRPRLLPALLENTAIPETKLAEMAAGGSRDVVLAMQQSARVQSLPRVRQALASNPNATHTESAALSAQADALEEAARASQAAETEATLASDETQLTAPEDDAEVSAFLAEHAKELSLEPEKPFQPLGGMYEFEPAGSAAQDATPELQPSEPAAEPVVASAGAAVAPAKEEPSPAAKPASQPKTAHVSGEGERGSCLQKIARLDVKGRIQLAMKGNKEERGILIRDGTKLVALAVLESGKITDGEVEKFAGQKNVLEAVLRQIPMKRRFAKNYNVVRNLVANPRTPLDVSLGLMKNILAPDLRNLASNKDVPETIRKLALKMFKQKTETKKR